MRTRSLLTLAALAAVAFSLAAAPQPQQSIPDYARQRDEAAVKDADSGWYGNALKTRDQRLQWFREARFGCFIHWGVYSALGGEYNGKKGGSYSEHIMRQLKIPRQEYLEKVVAPFNPEKFDADQWVKLIKGAGMKYLVITAKHHDGFAMYPSDVTKYNIRDATSFKRDPMMELSEACRKNGIRFGFYYSHAFDWEHPDASGNDWDYKNPGGDLHLFDQKEGNGNNYKMWYDVAPNAPELVAKAQKYVDEKAIPQLQELIKKYHPDIFWFDTSGKLPPSEQIRILKAVRLADPDVVINGRGARGMGRNFGDYVDTADNPAEVRENEGDWEAIPTVNSSYGYSKYDNNYKTPEFCIRLLAKIAAKGGNMLLNIGPKGDGTIDENATSILTGIGKWMDVNAESIHGTTRTPLDRQAWGDSTVKGNTLYLHVFQWPTDGKLVVGGLAGEVKAARILEAGATTLRPAPQAKRLNDKDVLVEALPSNAPDATDTVIALTMDGPVKGSKGRLLATNIAENQLLAFDAKAKGKFSYGDGKAGRYYATGFGSDNNLSWPVRVNEPATFEVTAKYSATRPEKIAIKLGQQTLTADTKATKGMEDVSLGQIKLEPGNEQPLTVSGDEGLSLFELDLKPVH